jgi:hypothetical protein
MTGNAVVPSMWQPKPPSGPMLVASDTARRGSVGPGLDGEWPEAPSVCIAVLVGDADRPVGRDATLPLW